MKRECRHQCWCVACQIQSFPRANPALCSIHLAPQGKTPDKDKVAGLKAGMADRAFTSLELTNYRKGGAAFQNLLCLVPVMDTCDALKLWVGVQCDLDERRRRGEHVDEHFAAKWQEQVGPGRRGGAGVHLLGVRWRGSCIMQWW